jgi:hypothetical protein
LSEEEKALLEECNDLFEKIMEKGVKFSETTILLPESLWRKVDDLLKRLDEHEKRENQE